MKRAILCEICKHQECALNARLHRQIMTCAVRPGVVAEQVICFEFEERNAQQHSQGVCYEANGDARYVVPMVRQVAK